MMKKCLIIVAGSILSVHAQVERSDAESAPVGNIQFEALVPVSFELTGTNCAIPNCSAATFVAVSECLPSMAAAGCSVKAHATFKSAGVLKPVMQHIGFLVTGFGSLNNHLWKSESIVGLGAAPNCYASRRADLIVGDGKSEVADHPVPGSVTVHGNGLLWDRENFRGEYRVHFSGDHCVTDIPSLTLTMSMDGFSYEGPDWLKNKVYTYAGKEAKGMPVCLGAVCQSLVWVDMLSCVTGRRQACVSKITDTFTLTTKPAQLNGPADVTDMLIIPFVSNLIPPPPSTVLAKIPSIKITLNKKAEVATCGIVELKGVVVAKNGLFTLAKLVGAVVTLEPMLTATVAAFDSTVLGVAFVSDKGAECTLLHGAADIIVVIERQWDAEMIKTVMWNGFTVEADEPKYQALNTAQACNKDTTCASLTGDAQIKCFGDKGDCSVTVTQKIHSSRFDVLMSTRDVLKYFAFSPKIFTSLVKREFASLTIHFEGITCASAQDLNLITITPVQQENPGITVNPNGSLGKLAPGKNSLTITQPALMKAFVGADSVGITGCVFQRPLRVTVETTTIRSVLKKTHANEVKDKDDEKKKKEEEKKEKEKKEKEEKEKEKKDGKKKGASAFFNLAYIVISFFAINFVIV